LNLSAPERPKAPFGARSVVITERRVAGPYVALTAVDPAGPVPAAGQFYMLRAAERWGGGEDGRAYLPRALSFARCTPTEAGTALDFLFEPVGPGTERLAQLAPGEELVLTGPFGNGFVHVAGSRALLVAGGIGLAPIVALRDQLIGAGEARHELMVGMRSHEHAEALGLFGIDAGLTTDDGSAGEQGFVTTLLSRALDSTGPAVVYACGPDVMLDAVRAICTSEDVPGQLAMESGMACGFGACFGCVVPTEDGYIRLCVDGPVVAADRVARVERAEQG
jgi:NAD(P)H-flavin reductase